jgi:hypothetical protein
LEILKAGVKDKDSSFWIKPSHQRGGEEIGSFGNLSKGWSHKSASVHTIAQQMIHQYQPIKIIDGEKVGGEAGFTEMLDMIRNPESLGIEGVTEIFPGHVLRSQYRTISSGRPVVFTPNQLTLYNLINDASDEHITPGQFLAAALEGGGFEITKDMEVPLSRIDFINQDRGGEIRRLRETFVKYGQGDESFAKVVTAEAGLRADNVDIVNPIVQQQQKIRQQIRDKESPYYKFPIGSPDQNYLDAISGVNTEIPDDDTNEIDRKESLIIPPDDIEALKQCAVNPHISCYYVGDFTGPIYSQDIQIRQKR